MSSSLILEVKYLNLVGEIILGGHIQQMSDSDSNEHPKQNPEQVQEQPKKKKKTNLRHSNNQEDNQYVTSASDLLTVARIASAGIEQKREFSRKRDEERLQKQKERDSIKEEKRLARYERSLAKKNKLQLAASVTTQEKKEKVREMYQKQKDDMGSNRKQKFHKKGNRE